MSTPAEKEVLKIYKKIEKYHNEQNNTSMSEALTRLKRQPVTIEILQHTKIGVLINRLRRNVEDREVKQQMRNLIKNWKSLTTSPSNTRTEPDNEKKEVENTTIPVKQSEPVVDEEIETPILQKCGDPYRDKTREMLAKALYSHTQKVSHGICNKRAVSLEEALFEIYQDKKKYRTNFMSKLSNLKDVNNPELRTSYLNGVITAHELAKMTPADMASKELKDKITVLEAENLRDAQTATNKGTKTDMFTCSKCKHKECTYTQLQTRSSDEPMTTFVYCMHCGNRWKFC